MVFLFSFLMSLAVVGSNVQLTEGVQIRNESCKTDIEQDYDVLFMYRSAKRDVEQRLYIKRSAENKVLFRLIVIRENCDTAIDGEAVTDLNNDPEIDEDSEGMAYNALAYSCENANFNLVLRIAEDKMKTIVQFEPNQKNAVSCIPVSDKLMHAE